MIWQVGHGACIAFEAVTDGGSGMAYQGSRDGDTGQLESAEGSVVEAQPARQLADSHWEKGRRHVAAESFTKAPDG
jgi:hypothetical protein